MCMKICYLNTEKRKSIESTVKDESFIFLLTNPRNVDTCGYFLIFA